MSAQQSSDNNSDSLQTSDASKNISDTQNKENDNSENKVDDKVQGLFNAFDRRLNHQSAYINKLEKTVKNLTELSGKTNDDDNKNQNNDTSDKKSPSIENSDLITRVKELEEKQAVLNSIASRQKERAKIQEIRASLESNGVPSNNAERFAKLIAVEQSEQIVIDENNGDYKVQIKVNDGFSSIQDWAHAYLQTDEGQAFLPPKQNPVRGNAARGQATVGTKIITEIEAQMIDPKELMSGKYQIKTG